MRAAAEAGREVFGYNRSVEGAQGARADGFDATTDSPNTDPCRRHRRADRAGRADAGTASMLAHVSDSAPDCPLTDVTSVKGAVLDEVAAAGLLQRFVGGHPMTGTADRVGRPGTPGCSPAPVGRQRRRPCGPRVCSMVMTLALDCGAVVVPAKSDEHDAAAAAISHLPHLLAEALAITAAEVPLAFALAAGSFRDGTRVAASAPDLVRAMCEGNSGQLLPAARPSHRAAEPYARLACLAQLGCRARRSRPRSANPL